MFFQFLKSFGHLPAGDHFDRRGLFLARLFQIPDFLGFNLAAIAAAFQFPQNVAALLVQGAEVLKRSDIQTPAGGFFLDQFQVFPDEAQFQHFFSPVTIKLYDGAK